MTGKETFKDRLARAALNAAIELKEPALRKRMKLRAAAHKMTEPLPARQTFYNWINGTGEPSVPMLYLLADALDVDARWLGIGEGGPERGITLSSAELDAIKQIYRPLAKSPKALAKWIKDGRELVEISTFASAANPFAKV